MRRGKCISYASYFQRTTLSAHGSSDMQEPPNNLAATYVFAILALLPNILDTGLQWFTVQQRAWKYLLTRGLPLAIILFIDIGLIVFIENYRSRQRTEWLLALWILLELSILLNLSVEMMIYQRMCNKLNKNASLQKLARWQLYSVMAVVLILDVLAFSFVVGGYRPDLAVILQALGSLVASAFSSAFPLWFLSQEMSPQEMRSTKKAWGALGCSCAGLVEAVTSVGLLGLPDVYQKLLGQSILTLISGIPLIVLQTYKLVYKSDGASFALSPPALPEGGRSNGTSPAFAENGHLDVLDIEDPQLKGNFIMLPNILGAEAKRQHERDSSSTLLYGTIGHRVYTLARLSKLKDDRNTIANMFEIWVPDQVLGVIELSDGCFELPVLESSFQELESQLLQVYPGCRLQRYNPIAYAEEDTMVHQYALTTAFYDRVEEAKRQGHRMEAFYSEVWDGVNRRISPTVRKYLSEYVSSSMV
ncbi:hypothetical protein BDZ45DRAFT_307746 [Acephala macrosclerotiorum]|nr:hypothetical protein BDZ45DRAFT_307746 [Acephala macrosclerotiorum]